MLIRGFHFLVKKKTKSLSLLQLFALSWRVCKLLGVHAAVLRALGFPLSNLAALYSDTSFIHFITLWCHSVRVFKSIPCCLKGLILWLSFLFFLRNRKTFAMIVINNWYSGWHPSKVHPRAAVVFGI